MSGNNMSVDYHLHGVTEVQVYDLPTGNFTLSIESEGRECDVTIYFPYNFQGYATAIKLRDAVCKLVDKLTTNPIKENKE